MGYDIGKEDYLSRIAPEVTAVVVVDGDGEGIVPLVESYIDVLSSTSRSFELLLMYHDATEGMRKAVVEIAAKPSATVVNPRPWTGEDAAMVDGIRRSNGEIILTLPGWPEVAPDAITDLLEATDEVDLATGRRIGQAPSTINKPRTMLVNSLVGLLFKQRIEDIFCRTRAGRKEVFEKIVELGVRQHFLPVIAVTEGYTVREVPVAVAEDAAQASLGRLKPSSQFSALFDMLSLYIALNFLKRPLRFFGAIGLPLVVAGLLLTLYLVVARLFFEVPLADRPALVFSVMMLVLGIQILALGLVGEIIIFTSSRKMRGYEIETILRGRVTDDDQTAEEKSPRPTTRE